RLTPSVKSTARVTAPNKTPITAAGVFPEAQTFPTHVFPNVLHFASSPEAVIGVLFGAVTLAVLFTLGVSRRLCALALWYLWACFFARDPFIANPSLPYVGWTLLATTLVRPGEHFSISAPTRDDFQLPVGLATAALLLLGLGYTLSGIHKAAAPSWQDGTALWHVLRGPLARPGIAHELLMKLPAPVWQGATWSVLALECLALPLLLIRTTRRAAFLGLTAMHLGILATIDFADLTWGMIAAHGFAFPASSPLLSELFSPASAD
ncbi:MAG: hypothetical protein AAFX94_11645, partial [Myxococcota bacterium]